MEHNSNTERKIRTRNFFWGNSRKARLLEWLESHPLEAKIVYTTRNLEYQPAPSEEDFVVSKSKCYDRAAQVIFAVDEDIRVRNELQVHPGRERLCENIRHQIERWRNTYLQINDKILNNNPNQNLGDIQPGTQIYMDMAARYPADSLLWGRLNALWHSLFCWDVDKPKPKRVRKKRRVSRIKRNSNRNCIVVTDSDSDIEEMRLDSSDEEYQERERPKFEEGSSKSTSNRLKRKFSEGSSTMPAIENPTTFHQHVNASELEEQRLKLEIQKLENDALRIKMKMERQRGIREERNRLQEALMGLINSLPTEDADFD